jgi:predicted secreted acid phosphatase
VTNLMNEFRPSENQNGSHNAETISNGEKKKCVVFDLDGTICDVSERRKFLTQGKKNWAAWNNNVHMDTPNVPVVAVLRAFMPQYKIIFVSGRGEDVRQPTMQWLNTHIPELHVGSHNLFMRKARDYRDDAIVKSEIADEIEKEHEIFCVFDDRQRVVNMWIQRGVFVFDVAQGAGNF